MTELTFLDHLKELRRRLIISFAGAAICSVIIFIFYPIIIEWLTIPLKTISTSIQQHQFFVHSFFEGFITKFKFSIIGGIVLAFPIFLYEAIRFIFPGLTKKEKRVIGTALLAGLILAAGSLYFAYFKILPFSVGFLTAGQFIPDNVGVLLNFNQNLFFIFNFLLAAMILFQFPILLELLLYFNIVSRKTMWKSTRYVVLIAFIITAVITPPDVISQITLAVPLIGLYFLTLLIAVIFRFGEG